MPVTLTSGLFPVAQLPAAQLVKVRVILTNLENQPATVGVVVDKLVGNSKQPVLQEDLEISGDDRRILELDTPVVEGQTLEVTVTVPSEGFIPGFATVTPQVAIVSLFTGDGTTSLLQSISANDFAAVEVASVESPPEGEMAPSSLGGR